MEVIQDNHAACDQPLARYMYGGQANEVLTFDKYEDPCPALLAEEEEPAEGQPIQGQPIQGSGTGTGLQPGGGQQLGGGPTLTETLYYVHDANLWIVAIEDAAGEIVERTSYDDPYGNPLYTDEARNLNADQTQSSTGSPFLMRAYRLDPDATGEAGIGLVYLINRHYDTHTGNFIQRDPIGMWTDIVNLGNAYSYVGNNPINHTDPYGYSSWEDWTSDERNEFNQLYDEAILTGNLERVLTFRNSLNEKYDNSQPQDIPKAISDSLNKIVNATIVPAANTVANAIKTASAHTVEPAALATANAIAEISSSYIEPGARWIGDSTKDIVDEYGVTGAVVLSISATGIIIVPSMGLGVVLDSGLYATITEAYLAYDKVKHLVKPARAAWRIWRMGGFH